MPSSNIYQRRSISAGISRSLNTAAIKGRIDSCDIVQLFRNEALEAGYILNILYNLDKLTEMKGQQSNTESQDIEHVFMDTFWNEINKFRIKESDEGVTESFDTSKTPENIDSQPDSVSVFVPKTSDQRDSLLPNLLGEMDALLSMGLEQYASSTRDEGAIDSEEDDKILGLDDDPSNCYNLYEK